MKRTVTFDPADLSPVVEALDQHGWVNLWPDVEDGRPAPSTGWVASVFSSRGSTVPLATWHPGERSAGIEHETGPKLARRISVPTGWKVMQDHPRRGLVVHVPRQVDDLDVLRWLVDLGTDLCPVPTEGRWIAELHS